MNRRRQRLTATLGALAAVLFAFLIPMTAASAHAALISGTPSCDEAGVRVVTWTIVNDFNLVMTIDTAVSTPLGTTVLASTTVAQLGQTTGTTTLPGTTTGTVTLSVHAHWSDQFAGTFTGSTFLPDPCPGTSTTTTSSTSTSTSTSTTSTSTPSTTSTTLPPPDSTTTIPPPVSSSTTEPTTTTPPTPPTTTPPTGSSTTVPPTVPPPPDQCIPGIPPCAHTGSNTGPLVGIGSLALLGGAGLIGGTRRRRART